MEREHNFPSDQRPSLGQDLLTIKGVDAKLASVSVSDHYLALGYLFASEEDTLTWAYIHF